MTTNASPPTHWREYALHGRKLLMVAWLVFLIGHSLQWWHSGALQWVAHGLDDARARWVASQRPAAPHPDIVILDIDEDSLARMGRWPWSRTTLAKVVERAFHPQGPHSQGVRSLGIDMLLSEPERTPGADAQLAATLARYPVTTGWFLSGQADASTHGNLPMPTLSLDSPSDTSPAWPQWHGYTMTLDRLDAVCRSGVMNALFDTDGNVRRVPLLSHYDGQLYESLALSVWRSTLPAHDLQLISPTHLQVRFAQTQTAPLHIPLDAQLSLHLSWRGRGFQSGGGFDYIPIGALMAGDIAPERLANKIALLGSTAAGMMDLRATPVNPAFAGVELHALILSALLEGRFLHQPDFAPALELLAMLLIAAVWWALRRQTSVWRKVAQASLLAALWLGLTQWLYLQQAWLISAATPLALVIGWLLLDTFWGYWLESRQRRHFIDLFGQYVPPQLVARMAQDPQRYSMAPQSARLSILFSDVRGFTSIAESLSPDDLRDYINAYLSAMTEVIAAHEGTLDKFIGDAVMAFWGAPVAQADHAHKAVTASLQMLQAAQTLSTTFEQRGWPALKMGIGLNCGEVRVGDMGSRTRRAYTVMGDAVNLASRLEGLCKVYGCTLIVSEHIQRECPDIMWLEVDTVRVKGKEQAVTIATALTSHAPSAATLQAATHVQQTWQAMKQAYVAQQWNQATQLLDTWQNIAQTFATQQAGAPLHAATLADLYQQRIAHYRLNPPGPQWDGVTRHEEK